MSQPTDATSPKKPSTTKNPTKRVLIIGLDGATFTALNPLMDAGRMPRLKEAVDTGASGFLRSTTPALTPAAWTSFLTGMLPGKHGIIDFEQYDAFTNTFTMNSSRRASHVRNLWQILSGHGRRVGSLNVPMTFPPMPVNGFLVTGFETPGPESDFVHPPDLRDDILSRWPDPTFGKNWRKRRFGGIKLFRENVEYLSRSFHQGADMAIHLGDKHGWDALMVVLKLVDNLQHKTWKYIDERFTHRDRARRAIVADAFAVLDSATGRLLDYADRHDAMVLIVSDHGHGSLEGKAHPNALLKRWGYLKLGAAAPEEKTQKKAHIGDVERALPVDFAKTTACVMHAGNAGFLYINLRGRQPTGIVDPADFEPMRDKLIARLTGDECRAVNPAGESIPVFTDVVKPEEAYGCSRESQPWLPDLILIPHETLSVVRRLRGRTVVKWFSYRRLEGTHRSDGILIAHGPGIAHRTGLRAHITDCAPTVLAAMGLPIPNDMDGRIVGALFAEPPTVVAESAASDVASAQSEEVYSAAELQKVTERLSDLGYLE